MAMRVSDHSPQRWFLLEDAGELFLDVNCNHSFVGYDFMIRLSAEEAAEYRAKGKIYLDRLAQEIQDSAPVLAVSKSPYKNRAVTPAHRAESLEAIKVWLAAGNGA
jgi:hypothetical protein